MDYKDLKQNPYIGEQFEIYKKTPEYKEYTELIQHDKPMLSPYLIEMCIFGYFYEELRNTMQDDVLEKYPSLFVIAEEKPYKKEKIIPEYKGVNVYESTEDYLQKNPNVKPIKMNIKNPFTILED